MKRVTVILIFGVLLYGYIISKKAREYADFQKWVECLEQSDYSDSECEECDRKFNKEGKFNLSEKP